MHPGEPGVISKRATDAREQVREEHHTTLGGYQPGHVPAIDDYRSVMLQRAVFQSVASMGLPAFTIHSIVKYSGKALKDNKNLRIRNYGPIGVYTHAGSSEIPNLLMRCSLASQLYPCFHTCSISRSRRQSSGVSIRLSPRLAVQMQSVTSLSPVSTTI